MTHHHETSKLAVTLLCIGLLLSLLLPFTASATGQPPANAIEWQITDTKVVSPGEVITSKEGKTRMGMKIEGKAVTGTPDAIFAEGVFSIDFTVFKPERDMPSPGKDLWQLRGNWTITAKDADPAIMKARHNPYVLGGALNADLPFDPALKSGALEAVVRLQRGGIRPWAGPRARGTFMGNSMFEGKLTTPFIPATAKGKEAMEKSE
jgi:hypothetical protein